MTLRHVGGSEDLGTAVGEFSPGAWECGCVLCLAWSQEPPLGEEGMDEERRVPWRPLRSLQKHEGSEGKSQDTLLETAYSRGPGAQELRVWR